MKEALAATIADVGLLCAHVGSVRGSVAGSRKRYFRLTLAHPYLARTSENAPTPESLSRSRVTASYSQTRMVDWNVLSARLFLWWPTRSFQGERQWHLGQFDAVGIRKALECRNTGFTIGAASQSSATRPARPNGMAGKADALRYGEAEAGIAFLA